MVKPQGALKLVIFDWSGTTVDFGSFAPVAAFVQTFHSAGIEVSVAEARRPMGIHKKEHLRAMLRSPEIAQRWLVTHGRPWSEADVDRLYEVVTPRQLESLDQHSGLTPGLLECLATLRQRGLKVGGTTGYFRAAALRVQEAARIQGYIPDLSVCADEVPRGRPAPWMIYRVMEGLDVYPPSAVVKVGDTLVDIAEGRNAGVWSLGIVDSSSEMGCTQQELAALPREELSARRQAIAGRFLQAGAHGVVETLARLPALLDHIEHAMEQGEKP